MSACISNLGEYSEHTFNDEHWCSYCGVFDEDALVRELADLRAKFATADRKLALIEVTVALWEAGAREMKRQEKEADGMRLTHLAVECLTIARTNRAHAESLRDILSGE